MVRFRTSSSLKTYGQNYFTDRKIKEKELWVDVVTADVIIIYITKIVVAEVTVVKTILIVWVVTAVKYYV